MLISKDGFNEGREFPMGETIGVSDIKSALQSAGRRTRRRTSGLLPCGSAETASLEPQNSLDAAKAKSSAVGAACERDHYD
ncbi:hypothetical protein [Mesorhizobium sp. M5C.F.Cr.IN.023.01.1.1]|uniref:hypothetical protein n=1 Tax=Mesorhizobium sp. M5C.F.Cr.IN.023.01.1.1 TaxID=2496768 RepID=UPI0013E301AC|nr:hypothetical protein [Mesorhizobium sp. M5C.F.Cr.IN.023.01.1.1]